MSSSGLRVAMITTHPPDRGNMGEYGFYLSQGVSKSSAVEHVHVLANKVDGAPSVEHVSDKLSIHRVWKLGNTFDVQNLIREARALKPDVVHLNAGIRSWGKGRVVNFLGAGLGGLMRVAGLRSVVTLHHIGETMRWDQAVTQQLKLDPITRRALRMAGYLYLQNNIVTVTLGSMQRILHESFGANNVAHLPHGTFGARVDTPPIPAKPRILVFGFWGAFKDADIMIEAVKALRETGVPAELVLGGGAHPYFPHIYQEMVQRYRDLPYVQFTGYVPEDKLGELFCSCSVVVLPYRTNSGASGVLNLCRSYGRPVVVSNDPAFLEQLRFEGGSAMVFSDKKTLVDGLRRILTDKALEKSMADASLEVGRRVSIDHLAERLVDMFSQLKNRLPLVLPVSPIVHEGLMRPLSMNGHAEFVEWPVPRDDH